VSSAALLGYLFMRSRDDKDKAIEPKKKTTEVALLGDVGGTNIRLMLKRLDMKTRTSTVLKPFKTYRSQEMESFEAAVMDFLKEFEGTDDWPTVGVVGIAGEVNNNSVLTTNV